MTESLIEIIPCPYVNGFSAENSDVSFMLKKYEGYSDFVLFEDGKPHRCFRFSAGLIPSPDRSICRSRQNDNAEEVQATESRVNSKALELASYDAAKKAVTDFYSIYQTIKLVGKNGEDTKELVEVSSATALAYQVHRATVKALCPSEIPVKGEGKSTQSPAQPEARALAARGAEAFSNEVPASPAKQQSVCPVTGCGCGRKACPKCYAQLGDPLPATQQPDIGYTFKERGHETAESGTHQPDDFTEAEREVLRKLGADMEARSKQTYKHIHGDWCISGSEAAVCAFSTIRPYLRKLERESRSLVEEAIRELRADEHGDCHDRVIAILERAL